jgi:hypothetical protein
MDVKDSEDRSQSKIQTAEMHLRRMKKLDFSGNGTVNEEKI